MNCIVTGAAGFIGSHVCDALLEQGHRVVGIDNLSTGRLRFLERARGHSRFTLHIADLVNKNHLLDYLLPETDVIYHLAAHADIKDGLRDSHCDLEQNLIATWNILDVMRVRQIPSLVFSSTGSVYGETTQVPTPESAAPFPQTSLYAASKRSAECFIEAYAEGYGIRATLFRFVSILGERYQHGHIYDFVQKLLRDPSHIDVRGDGYQKKSYLYVADCVRAITECDLLPRQSHQCNIYNLGSNETCTVRESLGWICNELGVSPDVTYGTEKRGWIGDNPLLFLDCQKIRSQGWLPKVRLEQAVRMTVHYLLQNKWLLNAPPEATSTR